VHIKKKKSKRGKREENMGKKERTKVERNRRVYEHISISETRLINLNR